MAIGPGFVPAQLPTGQKYFELPFNELLAGLSAKQKQFDEVDDTKNKIFDDLLKVKPFYESDKQYVQQVQNKLSSDVDNIINKYQGDLTKARPEIQKLAREINQELTTGNLATVNYNTAEAAKIMEDVAKAKEKQEFGQFSEAIGQVPNFYQRQQMQLQDALDEQGNLKRLGFSGIHRQANRVDDVKGIFDPLKASSQLKDIFDPETGFQIKQGVEGIYKPIIYQTALQNLEALSPNFQAELDYQIKSGMLPVKENAEQFLKNLTGKKDVSSLTKNLSEEELIYYAKANEVGKLGENRIFTKTQQGATPNTAWMNLQKTLAEEEAARQVTTVYDPALKEEIVYKTEPKVFPNGIKLAPKEIEENITFKNGKVYNPFKDKKEMTALDVKEALLVQEQEKFVKEIQTQYPELSNLTEEKAYKLYNEAKKDATASLSSRFEVSNIAKKQFKEKLLEGAGSLVGRDMQLKDSKGIDNDINPDNLAEKLGYDDATEFTKALNNARVNGYTLTNDKIPGAYAVDIQAKDGQIRRLFVAPDVQIQQIAATPASLSGLYKKAAATGQEQNYSDPITGLEFKVTPRLKVSSDKSTASFIPQIFVIDKKTQKVEETSLEQILNSYEKKISNLDYLGTKYKQTVTKQERQ